MAIHGPSSSYATGLRWAFIAAIALAVVPNGSVAPFNAFLNAMLFGALAAASAFVSFSNARLRALFGSLLILILALSAHVMFQAWSFMELPFTHPAWRDLLGLSAQESASISIAPGESIAGLSTLLTPFLVVLTALILHQEGDQARKLWGQLALLGGLLAVIALVRHELFSDAHLFGVRPRPDGALAGNFLNRNAAAAFYVFASCALLGLLVMEMQRHGMSSRERLPASFDGNHQLYGRRLTALFLLVCTVLALFLTQSRAGILGGVLTLSALVCAHFLMRPGGQRFSGSQSFLRLASAFLVAGAATIVFLAFGGRTILRLDGSVSFADRLCAVQSITRAIADHPIWGTGLSTFREVMPIYRQPGCVDGQVWIHAHNSWLEAYMALGVVMPLAIGAVLWLVGRALIHGFRARRRYRFFPLILCGTILYAALHSLVDFPLQIPGVSVYFAALLGSGLVICLSRSVPTR